MLSHLHRSIPANAIAPMISANQSICFAGGKKHMQTKPDPDYACLTSEPPLDSAGVLAYGCNSKRMIGPAKIYFIVFGILTIAGGVIGYVKAGSTASIIAGSITGILLLVAAFLLPQNLAAGLALAVIVSLLLAVQFVPKFLQTGKAMPPGVMSVLSVIGILLGILAWVKK